MRCKLFALLARECFFLLGEMCGFGSRLTYPMIAASVSACFSIREIFFENRVKKSSGASESSAAMIDGILKVFGVC